MIKWSEDLRIGHPVIDEDHQQLIDIVNLFYSRSESWQEDKVLHETLKALLSYGRAHFAREEKIQKESMYPECERHSAEHKMLIGQVTSMARAYFVDKTMPIDKAAIDYMRKFLAHWLLDHIRKFDTTMKPWIAPSAQP
jgi:hemerythrin-like metal-binding protein